MDDAIRIENLSKRLGKRQVLRDVSFNVARGDIFGYLGPNGAGKTTTIRVLLGLMHPGAGRVLILGQNAGSPQTARKIGFVLESDGLYDNLTGRENLLYYARIYGIARPGEVIDRTLKLVNLWDRATDKVAAYSKGMRQRLALARAIAVDPEVYILDEPTSGVDPSGQIEVRQLVLDLAHREGKTVFLSSHNLDEVQRICNRVALIDKGEIRLFGELERLQRESGRGRINIEFSSPLANTVLAGLKSLPEVSIEEQNDSNLTLSLGKKTAAPDVVSYLAREGVRIEQVKRLEASLEEIYAAIVKGRGDG